MKIVEVVFILFLAVNISVQAQRTGDTLTNDQIISLSKIGLQTSVIINKIQTSYTLFNVSTNAIIKLSKEGVDADVINEMIKSNSVQQSSIVNEEELKNPNVMRKTGIYYYNPKNIESPLLKLDPVKVNYSTSGGGYGGFGGTSTLANLNGTSSKLKILEESPVFYFYFDDKGSSGDWFESTSPNEFELVRLTVKSDSRFCKVGGTSSGFMTSSASNGIPEKDKVRFDYVKVNEGIFKITFNFPLRMGEYCYVFSTNTYKVFDFSIIK